MSAQWDDDIHHALHVTLTGESHGYYTDFAGGAGRDEAGPLAVLAKVLTCGFLHDGSHSSFRGRPWGQPVDTEHVDARRLLGYLQTHDQVGNRMTGDRAVVPPGLQAAGAALYLLAPTTPMIFMGEEWVPRRRGSTSRASPTRPSRMPCRRRQAGRVRQPRLVHRRRARPAEPPPRGRPRCSPGARSTRQGTGACSTGTGRASPCAGGSSVWARPRLPTFASTWTRPRARW